MAERKGINNTHLKNRNRGLVLQWIAGQDNPTRAEIARRIGLTKMTVTNIVADWIRAGWVEERESAPSSAAGRNPVTLAVAESAPLALGLYLSRTAATVLAADLRLRVRWMERLPLQEETAASLTDKLVSLVRRAIAWRDETRPGTALAGLGVSAVGPLDAPRGRMPSPTNFFGIRDYPVAALLEEACGLPVRLNNDMNAAALAEKLYGAGRPFDNFLYVGITDGVGAGIVSGGRLYQEASGFVGEIGHMSIDYRGPVCSCGARGCLETYLAMPVLLARLREATGKACAAADLVDMAALPAARPVLRETAGQFAAALTSAVNLFDPQCIFVGHEGAFFPDEWFGWVEEQMGSHILAAGFRRVPVRRSSFGGDAPLLGSACILWQELFAGRLLPELP